MEKLTLFKNCDVVIYNGDDEFVSNCVAKSMLSAREIAWSRKDMERPLYISKVEKRDDCTVISYRYLDMDNTFTLPFIDDASIENSLNCLAACLYLCLLYTSIIDSFFVHSAKMVQLLYGAVFYEGIGNTIQELQHICGMDEERIDNGCV